MDNLSKSASDYSFEKPSSSKYLSYTSGFTSSSSEKPYNLSNRISRLEINQESGNSRPIYNGYSKESGSSIFSKTFHNNDADVGGRDISVSHWSNAHNSYGRLSDDCSHNSLESYQNGGIVGLSNLGNTCFMNSILQCLSNTSVLTEYCLADRFINDLNRSSIMNGNLFRSYADLMKDLWNPSCNNSSVSPGRFKSQIQKFAPRFTGYAQQDSQEFLRYVLEGLHMEVNRVQKRPTPIKPDYEVEDRLPDIEKAHLYWKRYLSMDNSEIVDIFVGQLMSTLECTVCGFKSTTFDPFWDLSLPIPKKGNVNLLDCLELFTSKEEMDGNERPFCGRCKTRQRCTKRFSIQKFPQILVLHLKRFSGERFRSKLSIMVDYPIHKLDLIGFAAPSCAQNSAIYDLYAVSDHSGSVYTGHYTAVCLHPYLKSWFSYNDSHVHQTSARSAVSAQGYVLFYSLVH